MPAASIPYLMYHELELPGRPLCQSEPGYVRYIISERAFREQMLEIQRAGARGVRVSDALSFPSSPAVAITFDDGCETDLLYAAPILRELGFNATFFVTTGFLGKPGYMKPPQVHELDKLGFEIGCHSMTHPYLPDLDEGGLRREIVDAKQELEQITGHAVEHFSCPGGRYDERVIRIAREAGYKSLSTSRTHANSCTTDPFQLGRFAVMRDTPIPAFRKLVQGQGLWALSLQASLLGGAKQLLGNSLYDRVRGLFLAPRGR